MDGLILQFLQGKTTIFEVRALLDWRAESEANERRFREIERVWQIAEVATATARAEPPDANTVISSGRASGARTPDVVRRRVQWVPRSIAAAALVGVGYLVAALSQDPVPLGAAEFKTGRSETVTVQLGDGTRVRLAPESRLRLETQGSGRRVFLEGEAFFAVAEDAQRPFYVRTRVGVARVLGTRFNMRVQANDLQLLVVDGRVALAASGANVEIGPNELSQVVDGGAPGVVTVTDTRGILAWMGGALVFKSTPLLEVIAELQDRYGAQIELKDSSLTRLTVSAEFAGQSFGDVMAVICRVVNARCTIGDNAAVIAPWIF
jgi:transmembrane sensor